MRALRDYQQIAIQRLRQSLAIKRTRPILQLPTGAGKTLTAAHIIRMARDKGRRVLFTVPALSLVEQTVKNLYAEGIDEIGVIQANHAMTNLARPVQVASVQTLAKREVDPFDLVINDESHLQFDVIRNLIEQWPEVPFIGLSATPWSKGLGRFYDNLIVVETIGGMIRRGFLSPFRVFGPSHPDMTGVKITNTAHGRDYAESAASEAMQKGRLTADIVSTWMERAKGQPTLAFCVDRAHAMAVARQFERQGVATRYQDGDTPAEERDDIRQAFALGRVEVICSVATMIVGIDMDVRCIIWARPTQSAQFLVQGIGRGLRPVYPPGFDANAATDEERRDAIASSGKPFCTILDHSDTTLELGFVTDIHQDELCDGTPAKAGKGASAPKEKLPRECPKCDTLFPRFARWCPNCQFAPKLQARDIEVQDGQLVELDGKRKAKTASMEEKVRFMRQLKAYQIESGKSDGFIANSFREKWGTWPNDARLRNAAPAAGVDADVRSWLHSRRIAYAKRKDKERKATEHAA